MPYTEQIVLKPLAPFDFDLTALIFSSSDPQIRTYQNGEFTQILKVNSNPVLIKVRSAGTVKQPKLSVNLESNNPLNAETTAQVQKALKFIFNLDFDLFSFYTEIKSNPTLHKIAQRLFGLKNPTTPTVFESLVDSIVEQQISIKVAHTIEERIVKRFGEKITLDDNTFFVYPTPQAVAESGVDEVRQCGLSQRKAEYIHNAAALIAQGKLDLEGLKNQPDAEHIIKELDEIRGIGVWTAELTMLRGMQRLDALPADDFGIRRVISRYFCGGRPIKTVEARQVAESFGRWKGLAAFYLIIAEVLDIVV